MSTTKEQELRDAWKKDAPWGAKITFLDSINSLAELDELAPVLTELDKEDWILAYYRENLSRWPDPELPAGFQEKCPLLAARLDTPAKVRVLLRGAEFRRVTPLLMGEVLEDIIYRHEVKGEQRVVYPIYRGNAWHDALRIVYHTQLQAWTLTKLALPGKTSGGCGSHEGLFISWEEPKAKEVVGNPA